MTTLSYWKKLYTQLKDRAICIDIETTRFNGPIGIVGCSEPRDGVVNCHHFVRGRNLTRAALRRVLQPCGLLITFNGLRHDIPAIRREFRGVVAQGMPVLDLYILAQKLRLSAGLKTLESTFGIERSDGQLRRGYAIRLWQRYEQQHDQRALTALLAYNKQDTVNLYPLAEELMKMIAPR